MVYVNKHSGVIVMVMDEDFPQEKFSDIKKIMEYRKLTGELKHSYTYPYNSKENWNCTVIHDKPLEKEDLRLLYENISDPDNWQIL